MSSTTYHSRQNPSRARVLNPGYTSRAVTYLIKPPFISIWCFIRYNERLPFVWKRGNSGENLNGNVHSGGNFPEKTVIPFEVLPFSRFYRNDRNFLPFVWLTSARLPLEAEGDLF